MTSFLKQYKDQLQRFLSSIFSKYRHFLNETEKKKSRIVIEGGKTLKSLRVNEEYVFFMRKALFQ